MKEKNTVNQKDQRNKVSKFILNDEDKDDYGSNVSKDVNDKSPIIESPDTNQNPVMKFFKKDAPSMKIPNNSAKKGGTNRSQISKSSRKGLESLNDDP